VDEMVAHPTQAVSGPEVSVIVPTRNRQAFLSQTLRSVLWQQALTLEVIVVDDGSTDATLDTIHALADARIRVVCHDVSIGGAASRNHGVADASGRWLAFIDDDDLWAPDKLIQQVQEAEALRRDWAYSGAVVINAATEITRVQYPMPATMTVKALRQYDAVPGGGSNVIVRRATLQQTGAFDTRLPILTDWELYIRLAEHGPPACVPQPLVARRLHPSNLSLDVGQIVSDIQMIETLHDTRADWGKMRRWMAHSSLRAGRRWQAAGQFAMAVIHGQSQGVMQDVWTMFYPQPARPGAQSDAWSAAAEPWLEKLRRCAGP
jgi:glycosyltransferase involved in cell wall biosynthesis